MKLCIPARLLALLSLLNPHGSDETPGYLPASHEAGRLLNPHGSDETGGKRYESMV